MEHYTNTCQGHFIFPYLSDTYVLPNRRTKILTFEKATQNFYQVATQTFMDISGRGFTHLYEYIRFDELLQNEKCHHYVAIITLLTNFVLIRYIIASYIRLFIQVKNSSAYRLDKDDFLLVSFFIL